MQYFGQEASDYAKQALTGKDVILEFDSEPRDKYDRLLAYVWIGDENYNARLIRLGYARAYLRFPFRYSREFEKIGKEAQKNKVGLWADKAIEKLYDALEQEEKKERDREIAEQDLVIMDNLVRETPEMHLASAKLSDRWVDTVLEMIANEPDPASLSDDPRDGSPRVSIRYQGKVSKSRFFLRDGRFVCRTKSSCSLNFATSSRSDRRYRYEWDF